MRAYPFLYALICVGLLSVDLPATGADQSTTAPDKAGVIRSVLRDLRSPALMAFITEDGTDLYRPREWVEWCERFGADFREQRWIDHVAPAAQSQRYDDPVFRPWQERCPLLALNARGESWITRTLPPGSRGDRLRSLPPHMPDGSEIVDYQYATRDFTLFEGDFDNDDYDQGGEEVIFFADAYYSYWEFIARDERFPLAPPPFDRNWNDIVPTEAVPADLSFDVGADYRLVDLYQCRTRRLEWVSSPYHLKGLQAVPYRNGLIKYRDQYYIYELEVGGETYSLHLYVLKPNREAVRHQPIEVDGPPYCRFFGE